MGGLTVLFLGLVGHTAMLGVGRRGGREGGEGREEKVGEIKKGGGREGRRRWVRERGQGQGTCR